jgi:L-ribulose-5-phosphate 4-epimerase
LDAWTSKQGREQNFSQVYFGCIERVSLGMSKYDDYKKQVLATSQRLCEEGYFGAKTGSGGNISILVEGEEAIAITPSSMRYSAITLDDVCVVDFDGNPIEGERKPSVELFMHLGVYKNRMDVNAVVHSHPPYASIFAALNAPIPPLFDEIVYTIGDVVDVTPYGLSGSRELLDSVVSKLSNRCHCYIMSNHGALSIGATMDKAVLCLELLEKVASIYYRALATGRPLVTLSPEATEFFFRNVIAAQDEEIARKARMGK